MSHVEEAVVSQEKDPTVEAAEIRDAAFFSLSKSNAVILALVLVIVMLISINIGSETQDTPAVASIAQAPDAVAAAIPVATSAPEPAMPVMAMAPAVMGSGAEIERKGEGRLFYTTIKIPANAETLYLSGTGAAQNGDGTWGNMEEQAINTFTKFKATLESEGWSMSDIVQVRAFAVAGEYGLLDFDGFNRGYTGFFGTPENPNKPVRSFVQVAALVNPGWLVEVEIRAARVPSDS